MNVIKMTKSWLVAAFAFVFVVGLIFGKFASATKIDSVLKERSELQNESTKGYIVEKGTNERPSPFDWIKEGQIEFNKNGVLIKVPNAVWAKVIDTNSMDPVIDAEVDLIEIVPASPENIHVGDIVSYESKSVEATIVHRVVETGYDENGWYAIMKGDNNPNEDPEKVRWEQIKRIVVAIIY